MNAELQVERGGQGSVEVKVGGEWVAVSDRWSHSDPAALRIVGGADVWVRLRLTVADPYSAGDYGMVSLVAAEWRPSLGDWGYIRAQPVPAHGVTESNDPDNEPELRWDR